MNAMDMVRTRRSVRNFDGREIDSVTLQELLDFARKVQNPYDLPITWKILSAKKDGLSSPVITGTDTWIAGKMPKVPGAEEAFGYAFEKLVLFAVTKGIGTTWIAGTMDRKAFEKAMRLEENEVMPCVSPLGYPAEKMSLRETLMRKGIKADTRLPFEELFYENNFDHPLAKEKAGHYADAFEMVRWAPSAVNKQPWRLVCDQNRVHFYLKHDKGYINNDGWDLQKIDMGIALCHFELGMKQEGREVRFSAQAPNLAVPEGFTYIASMIVE